MEPKIRLAQASDLAVVYKLFADVHDAEESGLISTGWKRGVYPAEKTADEALARGDLYVLETERVVGVGIINMAQLESYATIPWRNRVPPELVTVLHTFAIAPDASGKGLGKKFMEFYERVAVESGAPYLRMDTNVINAGARKFYRKLGFEEVGFIDCVFNDIPGVRLVALEKKAG